MLMQKSCDLTPQLSENRQEKNERRLKNTQENTQLTCRAHLRLQGAILITVIVIFIYYQNHL